VTDRVRVDVKVSGGMEIASWAGASQFDSRDILDLARGNFESGTLGPVLQDIFLNDGAEFQYTGEKSTDGSTRLDYMFQVPAIASHFLFRVEGIWLTNVAYQGSIEIDAWSFDLKSLTVRNDNLPPETDICLVTDKVDYERMQVGSKDFLLPRASVLRTLHSDSGATETTLTYSSCREYQSDSTIHFTGSEPPPAAVGSNKRASSPAPLPAGLTFTVTLTDPIDSSTAAAGDAIVARMRRPLTDATSKSVLVPADALVHGRIVRIQHFLGTSFRIAIELETVEIGGAEVPLYAKPDATRAYLNRKESTDFSSVRVQIVLPPLGESPNAASFVFPTSKDRYVVPAGYESNWITILPAAKQ